MTRYGRHPALYGVELLNEPGDLVEPPNEEAMRSRLRAYYHQAYAQHSTRASPGLTRVTTPV